MFVAPISIVGNRKLNIAHANYYFRCALDSPEVCLEISQIIEPMRIYSQHKFVTCANEKGFRNTPCAPISKSLIPIVSLRKFVCSQVVVESTNWKAEIWTDSQTLTLNYFDARRHTRIRRTVELHEKRQEKTRLKSSLRKKKQQRNIWNLT